MAQQASSCLWHTIYCHKVSAMHRMVERYGAYLAYFTSLAADQSVKAIDKQKLIGYARKWNNSRLLLLHFHNLPTVKKVLSRIKVDAKEVTYQGAVISSLAEAKQSLARSKNAYAESISVCLKDRMNDQNIMVLNAIV